MAITQEKRNFELSKKQFEMKKIFFVTGFSLLLACSCGKALYSHYDYDEVTYFYAKQNKSMEGKDLKKLIKSYKRIVEHPKGANNVPPPGAYADYAYLLFLQGNRDEAKTYFQKEYVTYPESKVYVESLMQKLGL